jgi:hypothetical protein
MKFAEYEKALQIYMDKHDLPIMEAIDTMDLEKAEKIFAKIHIYEYMELHGVLYTTAVQLMARDEITQYNLSIS